MSETTHTRERALETYFSRRVREAGGMTEKFVSHSAGVPDRVVILRGRVHLVELKAPLGVVRPTQLRWHEQAAERGVYVAVLRSRAEVDQWIGTNNRGRILP